MYKLHLYWTKIVLIINNKLWFMLRINKMSDYCKNCEYDVKVKLHGVGDDNWINPKKSYSIKDVAKMFGAKVRYLPPRKGERYASALTNMSYNNKVIKYYGKINLKDYITSFIRNVRKKKWKLQVH